MSAITQLLDPCDWHLEGNPDLRREKSYTTTTIGYVFNPKERLAGLQLSVDDFRTKINEAVSKPMCAIRPMAVRLRNDPQLCSQIHFDDSTYTFGGVTFPGITSFRALSFNGASYAFKGLDF
jgi:outer membrane receptor for ferrienterochelin and colicin